ncbi:MAG: MarR family transcriptional regulator [Sphingomonadales bacterium]|nr:MarR family transcriptional regulator [Sphingomonadales bacterium]MDE2569712.1 MarR family transcriptional regulator [Sphingomonadales bacterium]
MAYNEKTLSYYEETRNSIGYLTRIAFRSFSHALEKLTLPHGVTAGQWRFLRVLWIEDGLTQRELSRRVVMREPTTVTALQGMEKAGLIRREQCSEDRRRTLVYLTPKAKGLKATLIPCVIDVNLRATQGMTDAEIEQLKTLLAKVCDRLAESDGGGTGEA